MCKAMEDYTKKQRIVGAIEAMKRLNTSDPDIVNTIMDMFDVTRDYVLALLTPKMA